MTTNTMQIKEDVCLISFFRLALSSTQKKIFFWWYLSVRYPTNVIINMYK